MIYKKYIQLLWLDLGFTDELSETTAVVKRIYSGDISISESISNRVEYDPDDLVQRR